jgi:hypothetical protein
LAGRGEAIARLRDYDAAQTSLEDALALFQSIRSEGGVVTAAQHLGISTDDSGTLTRHTGT